MTYLLLAGLCLLAYIALVLAANRLGGSAAYGSVAFEPGMAAPDRAPSTLVVTTWNIGYAGMGAESDFFLDLGTQRRPLSAGLVDRNLAGIAAALRGLESDAVLLQEVAEPSFVTWGRNVLAGVRAALDGHAVAFAADIQTRFVPGRLGVRVGNATFSRILPRGPLELIRLPLEPTRLAGIFRKDYRMHVLRLAGEDGGQWVIVNIHLSAFDTPEHRVREAQLRAVLDFAEAEYARGARVVVGGDWNLRLLPVDFPHRTEERFQFWIRDLPAGATPEGWTWATDPRVPTVRTAHQPYVPGENRALIVDGFLVSPNVQVEEVETRDLGFAHSDHQPVTARLRAVAAAGEERR